MSEEQKPWGHDPAPPPEQPTAPAEPAAPVWLGMAVAAALGLFLLALHHANPDALRTRDDWFSLTYRLGLVVLICAGGFRALQGPLSQHLRHAAAWLLIIAILALGYAYRDAFTDAGQRLQLAFSRGDPVATGEHQLAIPRDESGAFVVVARVNGQPVRFLVDTGATDTVLTPDDARRLGIDVDALTFDQQAETANGPGFGAPWTAARFEVGGIRLRDFPVTVNKTPMSASLLGLSFLDRLESFEARRQTLTLRWRDEAG